MREWNGRQYVDGAIVDTYPIDMFKDELDETLGFLISCGSAYHRKKVSTIDEYAFSVYYSMSKQLENLYLKLYGEHIIRKQLFRGIRRRWLHVS